ncbi:hypothetical protein A4G27_18150 [Mycobacterium kansasii]|uniref:Uncharacterized protein n=2 Tax=Mycobacterium pseudokansasii TaxID=2341080 RepID=A0A498QNS5_9MYCO|nr:hypothetical protein [Mycobacterium pseudokansasii]KZS60620.1 hypothetical protein A4G27_18150 [Mycobacterium kansasii]VBA47653.1 hypothetical protein LAUMK142_00886 [Mycobacterium pseudokansasii]
MDVTLYAAVVDFEVYLLMTMKPRLSLADTKGLLDAKLAKVGLSLDSAVRIHDRVAEALSEEISRFRYMKTLLGVLDEDATSLKYNSVLWPGFEFNAHADANGLLESAGYTHTEHTPLDVESPTQLAAWSCDILEFDERFGPSIRRENRPLFDDILPAYEGYEFLWKGDRYGAGFLWGLFLSSSMVWE